MMPNSTVKSFLITAGIVFCSQQLKSQSMIKSTSPLSPSLKVDNLLFISGQIGLDFETKKLINSSFENEVHMVMSNIKVQLEKHRLNFNNLANVTIYLKDMKNYDILNKVYGSYFSDQFPTRTCIAVLDLPMNASVEISAIANFK